MSYKNIKKTKLISLIFLSNIIKNHKKRAGEIPTMTLFLKKKPLVAVNFTIYENYYCIHFSFLVPYIFYKCIF
jgi:hypothetical protein